MAHSKYYKRIKQNKKQAMKVSKRTAFIIAIAVIVIFSIAGVKVADGIKKAQAEKNRDYGEISSQELEVQQVDENGNIVKTDEQISVVIIDVGQGQSIFVDTPKADILIDGGSKEHASKVLDAINPYTDNKIEYVISTNSDSRFSGGLSAIFEKYEVENVIYTNNPNKELISVIEKEKDCKKIKGGSENISLGDGIMLSVYDKSSDKSNLMCAIKYNGDNILLTTSMAKEEEETKVSAEVKQVFLYVAGSFGESSSSSAKFLNEIKPNHIIISSSGISSKEALERLKKNTSEVYGTFKSGTFILNVKGTKRDINQDRKNIL